jgi:hypothetical protein
MQFESTSLGAGAISSLLQFIPTPEEAAKVEQYVKLKCKEKEKEIGKEKPADDQSIITESSTAKAASQTVSTEPKLGKAEQYVYSISRVRPYDFLFELLIFFLFLLDSETGKKTVRHVTVAVCKRIV